ncbi:hypothetical protein C8R45DRAFT_926098 [Mycena sanguinolenta]|nr:hypothetical protein C8R45DRAFT_926098 [Mycena sanguinolenta]
MFSKAFSTLLVTALAVSASPAREARQPCAQTYTVVVGDTCAAIESRTGISDAQFHLEIGQRLCLSGGGSSPPLSGGISGLATFFPYDGELGACGSPMQNVDFIVGLGTANWDGGAHCGQTVNVQYQSKTIQDLCPGCHGANGIVLSEAAMETLDSNYLEDGVIPVVWSLA